jgi:hypothetical protein
MRLKRKQGSMQLWEHSEKNRVLMDVKLFRDCHVALRAPRNDGSYSLVDFWEWEPIRFSSR